MNNYLFSQPLISAGLIILTLVCYQSFILLQQKRASIWLNPMLLSIIAIATFILSIDLTFPQYYQATLPVHALLEIAVVALGYPLYQHLKTIRYQWQAITSLLMISVFIVVAVSLIMSMMIIAIPSIAVSLSLKSITTPIAIALTEDLAGNNAITACAIILAGLVGALIGPSWLNFIGVKSAHAQGLAIGAASHVLGTATISKISYEHAAFGSLSLILSAVITAVVSPFLIPLLLQLFT